MSWTDVYKTIPSGTGVKSTLWSQIPVANWQLTFCKKETYQPKLSFAVKDDIQEDLGLQYIEANPSTKVISTGIRHISKAKQAISACPAWIAKQGQVWADTPKGYAIHHNLDEISKAYKPAQLKADIQSGEFWYTEAIDTKTDDSLQLEHLFECRFAGPLIAAITENYTKTDATTQEALVLLDRIVNNKANLTWVPESLNTFKNNYFGGGEFAPNNANYLAFTDYMDQKGYEFRGLIFKITNLCFIDGKAPVYATNSTMAKMLKVLWESPFCQGLWRTLPAAGGAVCWNYYGEHELNMVMSKTTPSVPVWVFK